MYLWGGINIMYSGATTNEQLLGGTPRELTYGEKAVGLTFNPSQDPKVAQIKELYAKIIDIINDSVDANPSEKSRLLKIAITEAQTAQMWAVKGLTYQF